MLNLSWIGDRELSKKFDGLPSAIVEALSRKMQVITQNLRNYIIQNKLSGNPLNKRTGHLQQSIQTEVTEESTAVTGRVYSRGDVKYAAIHEFGGPVKTRLGMGKGPPKKNGKASFIMPERSFMRSSLREMKTEIIQQLQSAMKL